MKKVWADMGFTMKSGHDMTSIMYRVSGEPIFDRSARFIGYRGIGVEVTGHMLTQIGPIAA